MNFRPERFVLASEFARMLDDRGERLEAIVYREDGTAEVVLGPAEDEEGTETELGDPWPFCRLCYCSSGATCLVEGPNGSVIDCTIDERLGACTGCLEQKPLNEYLWRKLLLAALRQRAADIDAADSLWRDGLSLGFDR